MKRLLRYLLIGAGVVIAVIVAVLLIFREDLSQMALRSSLEYAEQQVVEHLPAGESAARVREDFDRLLARFQEGTLTSEQLKPLLDDLAAAYSDQELTTDEAKQILGQIREILQR